MDHEEARRKHVAGKVLGFGALRPPSVAVACLFTY